MAVVVSMTTEGLERFERILKDPNFIGRPRSDLLRRAGSAGRGTARKPLLNRGMHGVHFINAADSIRYQVNDQEARVTVYSLMPPARMQAIEEGRPPGIRPPALPIARWALRRPTLTGRRLPKLTDEERSEVFRAVLGIERQGVQGKEVFARVLKHWQANINGWLAQMARRLEQRWSQAA